MMELYSNKINPTFSGSKKNGYSYNTIQKAHLANKDRHLCRQEQTMTDTRDLNFGINIESNWLQMGQIWDFLRSVSVHFGSPSQNVLKLILKRPRFVTFEANLTQFGCQI